MIWAVDVLQNGEPEIAARYLAHPKEAIGADITSKYRVHPWVMETLVNELLSSPKQGILTRRAIRTLNCAHFATVASVVNALSELDRTSFFGETQTVDSARVSRRSRVCYWVRSGLIPSRAKALVWSGVGRA